MAKLKLANAVKRFDAVEAIHGVVLDIEWQVRRIRPAVPRRRRPLLRRLATETTPVVAVGYAVIPCSLTDPRAGRPTA